MLAAPTVSSFGVRATKRQTDSLAILVFILDCNRIGGTFLALQQRLSSKIHFNIPKGVTKFVDKSGVQARSYPAA